MSYILKSSAALISSTFVDNETPVGVIDGVNVTFTLANTPIVGTIHLFLNGMHQAIPGDYSIVGTTITYVVAPTAGSYLLASYRI